MSNETIPRPIKDPREDEKIAYMRERLDYIQSKAKILDTHPDISEKWIRKKLAIWRDTISVVRRHWPKTHELHKEMVGLDITEVCKIVEFDITHAADLVRRLIVLLEFPERYNKNYHDMFSPQPMTEAEFLSQYLKENDDGLPDHMAPSDFDWEKFKRAYKRYLKKFKEEHGND